MGGAGGREGGKGRGEVVKEEGEKPQNPYTLLGRAGNKANFNMLIRTPYRYLVGHKCQGEDEGGEWRM